MRDFSITRKKDEWYDTRVVDSYGNKYQNYFETAYEANKWVYYIWENEDNKLDKQELLANAIHNCKRLDKSNNLRDIL